MALKFACGWEAGDVSEAYTASGTYSVQATTVKTGGYAFRAYPTTTATGLASCLGYGATGGFAEFSVATAYVSFDFRYATKPSANNEPFIILTPASGNGLMVELRLNSDGTMSVYDGVVFGSPSLLKTGATVLSVDTWYRIDIKAGSSGASAPYEIRVNGTVQSDLSGTHSWSSNLARIYVGKAANRNGQTVDFFYDNLILDDGAYAATDAAVQIMSPDGDGTYTAWTIGSGSGSDWENIDEVRPSDTTYLVSTATIGDATTATLESTSSAGVSGTIYGALALAWVRTHSGNGTVKVRMRSGTTESDTTGETTYPSVGPFGKVFTTDPATSSAWTTGGLDGVEIGVIEGHATNTSRCYSTHLMVAYVPSTATPWTISKSEYSNRTIVTF